MTSEHVVNRETVNTVNREKSEIAKKLDDGVIYAKETDTDTKLKLTRLNFLRIVQTHGSNLNCRTSPDFTDNPHNATQAS